ncbi:MAG TPA: cation:proton antiporter [Friedmanniella sp.]
MPSFGSAAVVAVLAFLVPLELRAVRVRLPESAAEIVLGVVVGPQVLGWARVDDAVRVLSVLGLGFLLLLAGLESDVRRLRRRVLGVAVVAFAVSFELAFAAGLALESAGLVRSAWLVAVVLSATSLGVLLPVLDDAGQLTTRPGQVVLAGATVAELVPVVLLSVLFAGRTTALAPKLLMLALFALLVAVLVGALAGVGRLHLLSNALQALQDTTAEIRVRGVFVLLLLLTTVAVRTGLEAILGAFLAGVALRVVDRDERMNHSLLPVKIKAVGFGVFVPFFFVTTGMALDVRALVGSREALLRVPLLLLALVLARGLPALLYTRQVEGPAQLVAVGLLQATSLSLPVVGGGIGVALGLMATSTYAALVAAGLISVLAFPLLAVRLLAGRTMASGDEAQSPD